MAAERIDVSQQARLQQKRRWSGTMLRLGVAAGTVLGALSISAATGAASGASSPSTTLRSLGPTLFVGNDNATTATSNTLTSYPLPSTGNVKPTSTTHLPPTTFATLVALAFGPSGDLWVASTKASISAYGPTQVATGGAQSPAITITGATGAINGADDAAFDTSGNMWVSNWFGHSITEFAAADIKASGSVVPTVTISTVATDLAGLQKIAFDNSGNLWASNGTFSKVMEFTAAQLKTGGAIAPAVVMGGTAFSSPIGLAFDASGNLWVSNPGNSTLVQIAAATLKASGTPTAAVTITSVTGDLLGLWQIQFDSNGNLWVPCQGSTSVVGFTPAQLKAGGAVKPQYSIAGSTTSLGDPTSVAVSQAPTITAVTPTAGPASGGTTVTVHGAGFTADTTVTFGSTAATSVSVQNSYTLTAVAPPGGGTVNVTATTFAGTSATSTADQYTYTSTGYRLVASDGGIFSFGTAPFHGSMGGKPLNAPVVGMASDLATGGYWMVATDGGIFSFTAPFFGSMGGKPLNAPIVAMAALPTGKGYWLVAADGGVFSFGTATFKGSMGGKPLNKPIVGMAAQPTGGGYWMVASDGGIFSFGTATFHGSMGGKPLNQPIVAMTPAPTGGGYWLVASDGGIFSFTVPFLGSMGGKPLNKPIVGMTTPATGSGYWMVASDGGIFSFTVPFFGSMGGKPLNKPIVGMSAA
jgi:sugar lactone lactonase YvrE